MFTERWKITDNHIIDLVPIGYFIDFIAIGSFNHKTS